MSEHKPEQTPKGRAWLALVIAFPLTTVILSSIMIYLAYSKPDTRVDEPWRKEGLGIIKDGDPFERAALLGIRAQLSVDPNESSISVLVTHPGSAPETIDVTLSHATIAEKDQGVSLNRNNKLSNQQFSYSGSLSNSLSGKYNITIKHPERIWSLSKTVQFTSEQFTSDQPPIMIDF